MSANEAPVPAMPDHTPDQKPQHRRPAWLLSGLAGVAVGAGIVGGVWAVSASTWGATDAFELKGTMTLVGGGSEIGRPSTGGCRGLGGYSDIIPGAAVTVYDAAGKVVATGSLGEPKYSGSGFTLACAFPVSVPDVPKGSKIYQVEVSHRGKISIGSDEAEQGKFAASLS
ncbi:hypothetical protein OG883_34500 [Streptomyces sp. NBC_01142]|uniref:hypothetical protein n=1 Tax=Streptomyces sp. NBC_01142 TaxID=2975865 RepID=UPI00224F1F55|nr:hypothetical protein [Streptomyces sp. NBC_01142]MCX4824878.1 hypothetical protein [Streptomyces sp. NBC_01142]